MPYEAAYQQQQAAWASVLAGQQAGVLLCLTHAPVYTVGRAAQKELGVLHTQLAATGIPVYAADRGGQTTYHGPGQAVVYVICPVRDLKAHLRWLSQAILVALAQWGVAGALRPEGTGVWAQHEGEWKKLASIGVGVRRWVSYHGLALNVAMDLAPFRAITPCGFAGQTLSDMATVLGHPAGGASLQVAEVRDALAQALVQTRNAPAPAGSGPL